MASLSSGFSFRLSSDALIQEVPGDHGHRHYVSSFHPAASLRSCSFGVFLWRALGLGGRGLQLQLTWCSLHSLKLAHFTHAINSSCNALALPWPSICFGVLPFKPTTIFLSFGKSFLHKRSTPPGCPQHPILSSPVVLRLSYKCQCSCCLLISAPAPQEQVGLSLPHSWPMEQAGSQAGHTECRVSRDFFQI